MTEKTYQPMIAGSPGIITQGKDGVAMPSREVSQRDQVPSGADCAGRENEELEWARRHMPGHPAAVRPVRSVFRKTELHGAAPPSTQDERRKARGRTLRSLNDPDGTVPYRPFETAFRDFICSLMERQDRAYEELFLHIVDLRQQVDGLERRLDEARPAPAGVPEVRE